MKLLKILVTGGAGFIGSHVVELLIEFGYEVVVVDHLRSGRREAVPSQAHLIEIDILSPQMDELFAKEKPNVVIHLAAQVDVSKSIQNPETDAYQNILGTIQILNYCHRYNVQKMIFSSTCAVYGETADCSLTESDHIDPIAYYGLSKYVSEQYIQLFRKFHQVPFTILRYANVYGPRQTSKGEGGVVSTFYRKMLNGEAPCIYGDGEQTRDFVYVKDVAMANVLSITKGTNEIINIGTNTKTTINELYQMISSITSFDTLPIFSPKREGDIPYSQLDNKKAAVLLGWQPSYNLETGLNETFKYYKTIKEDPF